MKTVLMLIALLIPFSSALANCWKSAGERYGIEPELLQAIAMVESGMNSPAINQNRDGTVDVGLMQINSRHFSILRKYNIDRHSLIQDPCQNVMTGAWILAGNMQHFGYTWKAVGAYNAGYSDTAQTKMLREKYIKKVVPVYLKLKQPLSESTSWHG